MLTKILGAIAGEKVAGRNRKVSGALVGAAIPVIARRGLGPLALVLGAGWGAKKLLERRRGRLQLDRSLRNVHRSATERSASRALRFLGPAR